MNVISVRQFLLKKLIWLSTTEFIQVIKYFILIKFEVKIQNIYQRKNKRISKKNNACNYKKFRCHNKKFYSEKKCFLEFKGRCLLCVSLSSLTPVFNSDLYCFRLNYSMWDIVKLILYKFLGYFSFCDSLSNFRENLLPRIILA